MVELIGLSSHALAALLYGGLAVWYWRQRGGEGFNASLLASFGATAVWAACEAALGSQTIGTALAESARNLAFLCFIYSMVRGAPGDERQRGVKALYGAVAGVIGFQAILACLSLLVDVPMLAAATHILGLAVAAGSLVLLHNLYGQASASSRAALQLTIIALAAMWTYDLHLYTIAYLTGAADSALMAMRGAIASLLVPLFVLAGKREAGWGVKLSRKATFQSISIIAILAYFTVMTSGANAIASLKGPWVVLAQLGLLAAMIGAALLWHRASRLRAWTRVAVAKHFFEHRYDYREDWLRFTRAIGGGGETPLGERVVKALANMAGSPGGLLLMADDDARLAPAARWNWRHSHEPSGAPNSALVRFLETTSYVIDFGALRNNMLGRYELKARVPAWLSHKGAAWAGIPLVHNERLVGIVLLDHPVPRRPMDWEDYDLFRTAGIQAASYLAEARTQAALTDAQRFDEFNRRFAFIMHDIKNLVSQLSLVARNAERHADNPEFRADMVATLQSSVKKMNDLLARLSRGNGGEAQPPRPLLLQPLIAGIVEAKRRSHPLEVEGDARIMAHADPARLEQALGHLVQNAIDASPKDAPVRIGCHIEGPEVAISIADSGSGMSDEFVRTRLFQPFASTKPNGFGVGAFEARTLVVAMGGRIEVSSREGDGSRFTLYLPLAEAEAPPAERKSA